VRPRCLDQKPRLAGPDLDFERRAAPEEFFGNERSPDPRLLVAGDREAGTRLRRRASLIGQ
jgi:hypothetical protein